MYSARTHDARPYETQMLRPSMERDPGVAGNARLTALTGLLLLVLLFIEGITILQVRQLLSVHIFVGLLLIPPVLLKLASTGYRFARYYSGNPRYKAAGPPQILLRLMAPLLVLTTVAVFGTGIILLFLGPSSDQPWRQLHAAAFFLWFWLTTVHVLAYTLRAVNWARSDRLRPAVDSVAGVLTRRTLVVGSVILGVVLAMALLPWDHAWLQWVSLRQFGG